MRCVYLLPAWLVGVVFVSDCEPRSLSPAAVPGHGCPDLARRGTRCNPSDLNDNHACVSGASHHTDPAPEQRSNTFPIGNKSIECTGHRSGRMLLSCGLDQFSGR